MNLTGKKILLLGSYNLIGGTGGVEHVLCNMANVMSDAGMSVDIVTIEPGEGSPFFALKPEIRFHNLYPETKSFLDNLRRELTPRNRRGEKRIELRAEHFDRFIRKTKPDVIVCFSLRGLFEATLRRKFTTPVILTVHGNPANDYTERFPEFFGTRTPEINKLYEMTYSQADTIQVLCDSFRSFIPPSFRGNLVTIGNSVPFYKAYDQRHPQNGKIVCVASVNIRKHQDLLIRAFSRIADRFPQWSVEMWGDGAEKNMWQQLIDDLGMHRRIVFKGVTTDIKSILTYTDIFVLPSLCEGWPLALGEAMSMGIPAIGLETCDGVNEIIRHGKSGLLCRDDEEDMAEKIMTLMENVELRRQYGDQARKDMAPFTPDMIWNKWKKLIAETISKK